MGEDGHPEPAHLERHLRAADLVLHLDLRATSTSPSAGESHSRDERFTVGPSAV
ncbi:MAG: hypothetical protein Q8K58_12125 [Acidimicrobiales bacterium]|nr:hypothetical protein [Acidimicrobiales bacterium]